MWRRLLWTFIVYVLVIGYRLPPAGLYNERLDMLYCVNPSVCWHEIAHKMDRDLGYPSRTREWGDALRFVVVTETDLPNISLTAGMVLYQPGMFDYDTKGYTTGSSAQAELYANIYQRAYGNVQDIHPTLQPFYSASRLYTQLYGCLVAGSLRLCQDGLGLLLVGGG